MGRVTFDGALIREQGVTFAVVVVKRSCVQNRLLGEEAVASFARFFPGRPVVLMAQDSRGTPTYFGRRDLVRFLASLPLGSIPWKRYRYS